MNRDRIAELLGWTRDVAGRWQRPLRETGVGMQYQWNHPVPETLDGLLALWPREKWLGLQIRGYEAGCTAWCRPLKPGFSDEPQADGETPYEAVAKLLLLVLEFKAAAAAPKMQT